MRKIVYLFLILIFAVGLPVSAQSGYGNGDRVFGYCNTNNVEIYGVAPDETGISLTVFQYTTLFARGAGQVSAQTPLGQVVLSYDLLGNFRVQWIGGPYFATGSGDFTKLFNCVMPVYIATPVPVVPPTTNPVGQTQPTQQTIIAQQTITYNGTTVNQTVTLGTGTQTCASGSKYTVVRGDTLYRISRRCGVTVDALVIRNGIINRNLIYVGQILTIP